MRLVTLDAYPGGRTGVLHGDEILDFGLVSAFVPLAAWVPSAMPVLLAAGEAGLDVIRRVVDEVERRSEDERAAMRERGGLRPYDERALLAPIPLPRMLLSHGRAYRSHRAEMRASYDPTVEEPPSAFLKNANSIVGPGGAIVLPPQCDDMVDLEVEFSIVFGADCHAVDEADALRYVAGYTLINDVSARNWVLDFRETGNPDLNRMGKQLPTFTPLGPVVTTKDEIPDPNAVAIGSSINGRPMQSANTADLIYRVEALIAYFSRWYRFRAGDVLTTGSPGGNGFGRKPPIFLRAGDTVTVSAEGIGDLSNPIVAQASRTTAKISS
jgi:2-keto-4-pentenoate hydratase/2-oxohepta-3-ene-1,7-dioic acid hydratase in catechol pathway